MKTLELKIVPDVVLIVVAVGMWGATLIIPSFNLPFAARMVGGLIVGISGLGIVQAAGVYFRRSGTTVDPTTPGATSSLITSGVYRFTRNPIYLGMTLVLIGWAVFLLNPLSFALIVVFVIYITRFQIIPEERELTTLFGAEYAGYQKRVRRWL